MKLLPIRELLNRIRWDPEFGRGSFELAYWDRTALELVRVPLSRVDLGTGAEFLTVVDPDGSTRRVPLHRVRQVFRNGALLWTRPPPLLPRRTRRRAWSRTARRAPRLTRVVRR
jgi:uncharacterized protein (UPF0248 family)